MKLTNIITETYEIRDGFRIDITHEEDGYKFAWIYHKDFGIKNGMFGMQMKIEEFIYVVYKQIDEYIEDYIERFAPELNYLERR